MIRHPKNINDAATALSLVDQRVRDTLKTLWLSLPSDRKNWDELESNYRRLVDRALRDFKEDMVIFSEESIDHRREDDLF